MGLYLHSHPMDRFFKRYTKLWSKCFNKRIFDSFFNLESIQKNSSIFFIFIKENFGSSSIFLYFLLYHSIVFLFKYLCRFLLHPFWRLDRRILITYYNARRSIPFVRTSSIESLHLSLFSFLFESRSWLRIAHFFNSRVSLNLKVIT